MKYEKVQKNLRAKILELSYEFDITKSEKRKEIINQEAATLVKAQVAVDKQILEKPNVWGDGYDDKGNLIYDMYDCPNCGKSYEIDYEKYDYCPNCGQALDWSEWK